MASSKSTLGATYILGGAALAIPGAATALTGGVIYTIEEFNPAPHTPAMYRYDHSRLTRKRNSALVMSIIGGTVAAIYTADAISHRKLPGQGCTAGIACGTKLAVAEALRYRRFRHQLHSARARASAPPIDPATKKND